MIIGRIASGLHKRRFLSFSRHAKYNSYADNSMGFIQSSPIWKDALFVGTVSVSVFSMSAYLKTKQSIRLFQENTTQMNGNGSDTWWWTKLKDYWIISRGNDNVFAQLQQRKQDETKLRSWLLRINSSTVIPHILKDYMSMAVTKWYRSSRSQRFVYGIVALNGVIFTGWAFTVASSYSATKLMSRMFIDNTWSRQSYTLLTSTFSHKDIFHLGFNMYALANIGVGAVEAMGIHQFAAFYLTSGMVSMLVSRYCRRYLGSSAGSLGASGALLASLAALSAYHPSMQLSLIFLPPSYSFSIQDGIMGMILFDLLGLVLWRRMSIFDHAGHLGGMLFGLAYAQTDMGKQIWQKAEEAAFDIMKFTNNR